MDIVLSTMMVIKKYKQKQKQATKRSNSWWTLPVKQTGEHHHLTHEEKMSFCFHLKSMPTKKLYPVLPENPSQSELDLPAPHVLQLQATVLAPISL